MPWKFMPPPTEFISLPSQENILAVDAAHSPRTTGPTSSRSQAASTRMSLFKKTKTSTSSAACAPWLQPALKPTFSSLTIRRTQAWSSCMTSTLSSSEPLSIRMTSSRSLG